MTSTPPPEDPDRIRAGNVDRERVVQRLNDAFAEGRLDVHELDERVTAAYAAKTVGELQPLTADLPASSPAVWRPAEAGGSRPVARPPRVPERRQKGQLVRTALRWQLSAWLTAVLVNVVVWTLVSLSSHELVYFWPIWVAGPWGALLLAQAVTWRGEDRRRRRR